MQNSGLSLYFSLGIFSPVPMTGFAILSFNGVLEFFLRLWGESKLENGGKHRLLNAYKS